MEATEPHGIRGVFAFTREIKAASSVTHARFSEPSFGVLEDPVTGSAHGPLAAYLVNHGVLQVPEAGHRSGIPQILCINFRVTGSLQMWPWIWAHSR